MQCQKLLCVGWVSAGLICSIVLADKSRADEDRKYPTWKKKMGFMMPDRRKVKKAEAVQKFQNVVEEVREMPRPEKGGMTHSQWKAKKDSKQAKQKEELEKFAQSHGLSRKKEPDYTRSDLEREVKKAEHHEGEFKEALRQHKADAAPNMGSRDFDPNAFNQRRRALNSAVRTQAVVQKGFQKEIERISPDGSSQKPPHQTRSRNPASGKIHPIQ